MWSLSMSGAVKEEELWAWFLCLSVPKKELWVWFLAFMSQLKGCGHDFCVIVTPVTILSLKESALFIYYFCFSFLCLMMDLV